jgi:hypothetical protein
VGDAEAGDGAPEQGHALGFALVLAADEGAPHLQRRVEPAEEFLAEMEEGEPRKIGVRFLEEDPV